ncbi:DUF1631 family protein [Aliikangiella sp. G2MR2-5]|uniref:DUF1631 family protein n=1 Tax=Aliikangiella sp. G2MR2-5 TaxID=2788943 RepID=UPI0018A8EE29|nr:DUF1631 family protein [Aliikangiella sp. G2MR2-5]
MAQLKCIYFRSIVVSPRFLCEPDSVERLLLNEFIHQIFTVDTSNPGQEKAVTNLVNKLFERTLTTHDSESLSLEFIDVYEELKLKTKFYNDKSLIIQRRSVQAEIGQAISSGVRLWTQHKITELCSVKRLPEFIKSFIQNHWSRALQLEKLKKRLDSELLTLTVAKQIIVSTQPIHSFAELENFQKLRENLYRQLEEKAEEMSIDSSQLKIFLSQLKQFHKHLHSLAKQEVNKGINCDVIRLMPTNIINPNSRPESDSEDTLESNVSTWAESIYHKLEKSFSNQPYSDDQQSSPLMNKTKLVSGDWYFIRSSEQENVCQICRYSSYIKENNSFFFVNSMGSKQLSIPYGDLNTIVKRNHLILFSGETMVNRALNFSAIKFIENLKQSLAKEQIIKQEIQQQEEAIKRQKALTARIEKLKVQEREIAVKQTMEQLQKVNSGSWFNLTIDGSPLRRKLVAKKLASQTYVMVDRSGKLINEYSLRELAELYLDGSLIVTLENDLNNQSITSLLSMRRKQTPSMAN